MPTISIFYGTVIQMFWNDPRQPHVQALRDPVHFRTATVVLGAVCWPSGADLAPDAMYDAIRERGCWALD
jgi:hypothetical protein